MMVLLSCAGLKYREIVERYINNYPVEHCFETPNMQVLNEAFIKYDMQVCFMAEYFLPDINFIPDLRYPYEIRILTGKDFADLYLPEWSNALCKKRKNLDVLGIGAYNNNNLIGFAGCSAWNEETGNCISPDEQISIGNT